MTDDTFLQTMQNLLDLVPEELHQAILRINHAWLGDLIRQAGTPEKQDRVVRTIVATALAIGAVGYASGAHRGDTAPARPWDSSDQPSDTAGPTPNTRRRMRRRTWR
jgi:hypothetical protein